MLAWNLKIFFKPKPKKATKNINNKKTLLLYLRTLVLKYASTLSRMQYLDTKLFGIGKGSSTLFYHHKLAFLHLLQNITASVYASKQGVER